MPISIVFDLGSTKIKAGFLEENGCITSIRSQSAPKITFDKLIAEGDAEEYYIKVTSLYNDLTQSTKPLPIGIASQRSSFLLWNRKTGKPITPLISWQDRRALDWCKKHNQLSMDIWEKTGLPLTPYYAGPKLATILQSQPHLKDKIINREILFGTLETFIIWKWTNGKIYQTDPTMAARTLLFDIHTMTWSKTNAELFSFPFTSLPEILPTSQKTIPLKNDYYISCSIADQSASFIPFLLMEPNSAVINLGTGGFVLRKTKTIPNSWDGFLVSPIPFLGNKKQYILEGTINGLQKTLQTYSKSINLHNIDHKKTYNMFCIPDSSGIGAPHWRYDTPFTFSSNISDADLDQKCQIVYEGIIFRVTEIIQGLFKNKLPKKIFLSGGFSANKFIQIGLASCLRKEITIVSNHESTLIGAAQLASDKNSFPAIKCSIINPHPKTAYLSEKFIRWKEWVKSLLK